MPSTTPISLYLEYFSSSEDQLKVPLSTLVTISTLKVAEVIPNSLETSGFPLSLRIYLVPKAKREEEKYLTSPIEYCISLNVISPGNEREFILLNSASEVCPQVASCGLPAVHLVEQHLCITGLCSVLRYLVAQLSPHQDLLGYQGGCLSAPAEVSTWTKFCEIDLPEEIESFLKEKEIKTMPEQFVRFEYHMGQPIRMHNIRKRMQKEQKELNLEAASVLPNGRQVFLDDKGRQTDPIYLYAQKQHLFAEGPDFLLSDAILYPQFLLLMKFMGLQTCEATKEAMEAKFRQLMPKTFAWLDRVSGKIPTENMSYAENCRLLASAFNQPHMTSIAASRHEKDDRCEQTPIFYDLEWPLNVPNQSLYKSDPKRRNPNARIFTRQPDIDKAMDQVLEKLKIIEADPLISNLPEIDWNSLPNLVHPLGGELPPERLEKKCQQLQNLASAVQNIYQVGDVIVDFCSGGGHLAILLAYLLPEATVYLVENKEESLKRAINRVQSLKLKNCRFFQGNMDYFKGSFDIGVSLHACGVATDLVIQKCIENTASFVSCPCCYGSVQENHMVSYPRSQVFKEVPIAFKDYLVLGHTADQTHGTNDKEAQGRFAMNVIDTDRTEMALETGIYSSVILKQLQPPTCSPKNNLIIGQAKKK